jgi:hypothetical protein
MIAAASIGVPLLIVHGVTEQLSRERPKMVSLVLQGTSLSSEDQGTYGALPRPRVLTSAAREVRGRLQPHQ